MLMMTYSPTSL